MKTRHRISRTSHLLAITALAVLMSTLGAGNADAQDNSDDDGGLRFGKPTIRPGDCKASLQASQLRACPKPNRRVDIDLKGTK